MTSVDVNSSRTLVAMGDGNGFVSLFRYPATQTSVSCMTVQAVVPVPAVIGLHDLYNYAPFCVTG